ncbi:transmembrane protein 256-like [Heracleum sosnowskyi]|uniref:Transmembrane protein 256-like n=1 Tax=Heracleum sosnowskyi TaxID=360622 RepID=A0AAD8MF80_9APIA|nr:transmembrane protein 256-like [Heracleum sosnowskyi]
MAALGLGTYGAHVFKPKNPTYKDKSVLSDLIQEIEPLDVSVIQKDVPPTTVDAMKRTISGMLGLLPSDQFEVLIESLWGPLSKLLVSSMMTGCYVVAYLEDRTYSKLAPFGGFAFIAGWATLLF